MNYNLLDHLEVFTGGYGEKWHDMLIKETNELVTLIIDAKK
jgi:hypothetical protein